tara:strand:+ start:324 stop:632 length:309 start_codon:yes stop_codon:yes gene_type:complete
MTDTVNKALQKRKNDRTRARVVSQARKVQDTVAINKIPPSFNHERAMQNMKARKKQIMNTTFTTKGKHKLLSGGKAGGMSYILKEMKRRLMKGTPGTSSKTY